MKNKRQFQNRNTIFTIMIAAVVALLTSLLTISITGNAIFENQNPSYSNVSDILDDCVVRYYMLTRNNFDKYRKIGGMSGDLICAKAKKDEVCAFTLFSKFKRRTMDLNPEWAITNASLYNCDNKIPLEDADYWDYDYDTEYKIQAFCCP